MGCIFAILTVFTPRLAFILMWLFTNYIDRAFNSFLIPLLGFIFLPFTTIIYVLVYNPVTGLTGWDWIWIFLAFLTELSAYAGSSMANKDRIPGRQNSDKKVKEEEVEDAEFEEEDEEEYDEEEAEE